MRLRAWIVPTTTTVVALSLLTGLSILRGDPAWAPPLTPEATPRAPLRLELTPQKQIFSKREGLLLRAQFKALQPVRLCLEKDPLTQFQFRVFRAGRGELTLAPLVSRDTRVIFGQRPRVLQLASSQTLPYRFNLKRLQLLDGESWQPGDYSVSATFSLCPQDENASPEAPEVAVPAAQPARFMMME